MASSGRSIPGFPSLPDDDDPLGQLDACHDRMQRQLTTLQRLLDRQTRAGRLIVDDDVRAAAGAIRKYFDEAASRHHRDEEQDLFPAVIEAMAGSDAVCLHAIVRRLSADHRQLEQAWQDLRPNLIALAQRGGNDGAGDNGAAEVSSGAAVTAVADRDPPALDPVKVERFIAAHRSHLDIEDAELMPMARRLLSDDQVARIGLGMRGRRDRG